MGSVRMRGYKIWVWIWAAGMKEGGELVWRYGNDGQVCMVLMYIDG